MKDCEDFVEGLRSTNHEFLESLPTVYNGLVDTETKCLSIIGQIQSTNSTE